MVSNDGQDLEPLTPNHFLAGHVSVHTAVEVEGQGSYLKAWRHLQGLLRNVWCWAKGDGAKVGPSDSDGINIIKVSKSAI